MPARSFVVNGVRPRGVLRCDPEVIGVAQLPDPGRNDFRPEGKRDALSPPRWPKLPSERLLRNENHVSIFNRDIRCCAVPNLTDIGIDSTASRSYTMPRDQHTTLVSEARES